MYGAVSLSLRSAGVLKAPRSLPLTENDTPALRNDKLTAPYMHNGGKATLADVVDFYDRGGDVHNPELAKRIKPLGLSSSDKASLVDFLMNALTDCRTEREEAPFDHPSLVVPNGASVPATGGGHTCQ